MGLSSFVRASVVCFSVGVALLSGCSAEHGSRGSACSDDDECEQGLCLGICRSPTGDDDRDGLSNLDERRAGTDPDFADTDRDGVLDGVEAFADTDGDGSLDALESLLADRDADCIPDQLDPHDGSRNVDLLLLATTMCRSHGICAPPVDGYSYVSAACTPQAFAGVTIPVLSCDYSDVPGWQGPVESACDGVDNDCDGQTDEGLGYLDPLGTVREVGASCRGIGACADLTGIVECAPDARAVCSVNRDGSTPAGDLLDTACDNVDNDCDGRVDDSVDWQSPGDGTLLHFGEPCRGLGACGTSLGVVECDLAHARGVCSTVPGGSADQSSEEICNGLDDDCDGAIDEGISWVAPTGGAAPVGAPCGVGACAGGIVVCGGQHEAVCSTSGAVAAEVCNSLDDDCDGRTDEGSDLAAQCPTAGVCAGLTLRSATCDTASRLVCDFAPAGVWQPGDETRCNGLDDDCDGLTDEGVTLADGTAVGFPCFGDGACAEDLGTAVCAPDGLWAVCTANAQGTPETCNAIDDDCDGKTDEDVPGSPEIPCSSEGVCQPYANAPARCDAGKWRCAYETDPAFESGTAGETRCDGLDNDCDGQTDEALSTHATGKWSVVPGRSPPDRAVWPVTDTPLGPFLFGGVGAEALDGDPRVLGDLWQYDVPSATWARLTAQGPTARGGHAMTWDAWSQSVLIQGGFATLTGEGPFGADGGPVSTMWSYAPATGAWTLVDQDTTALADATQLARRYHVLVALGGGHLFLHGGLPSGVGANGEGLAGAAIPVALSGTLAYVGGKLTCRWAPAMLDATSPLTPWRYGHRGASDLVSGVAALAGGIVVGPSSDDTPANQVGLIIGTLGGLSEGAPALSWTTPDVPFLVNAPFPALAVVGPLVAVQTDVAGAVFDGPTWHATALAAPFGKLRAQGGAFMVLARPLAGPPPLGLLEGGGADGLGGRQTVPLDLGLHQWGVPEPWVGPPPRIAGTLVDIAGGPWLLGGVRYLSGPPLGDAWRWDATRNEWAPELATGATATLPRPRMEAASAAWDAAADRVWIWDDSSPDRLWTYDRAAHVFAVDVAGDSLPQGRGGLAGVTGGTPIVALQSSAWGSWPALWQWGEDGFVALDEVTPSTGAIAGAGIAADTVFVLYAESDAWLFASWSLADASWTLRRFPAVPMTVLPTGGGAAWDAGAQAFHLIGVVPVGTGFGMRLLTVDAHGVVEAALDTTEMPVAPALVWSGPGLVGFGGPIQSGANAAINAVGGTAGPATARTYLFGFECARPPTP